MKYYIADIHKGHENCLSFDNRPFSTIEEHDEYIKTRWNEIVNVDDEVYILGDISWDNVTKTIEFYSQLNGKKYLVKGNHDGRFLKSKEFRDLFIEISDYMEIQDGVNNLVLSHYPIPFYKNQHRGWIMLHGHVHSSFDSNVVRKTATLLNELHDDPNYCRMYNVGAMMEYMNYEPRTLDQIVRGYDAYCKRMEPITPPFDISLLTTLC